MVTAAMSTACSTGSTRPSPDGPSALVIASCPELAPLESDDFGATTLKLIEVAGQYRICRGAALAEKPQQ